MSLVSRVDAVVADLEALGTLPAFQVRRYARPIVVTPDVCPMLAVFPKETDPELESTTSSYQNSDELTVAWFENVVDSLALGQVNEAVAKSALAHGESIITRLMSYGPGIPGYAAEATECTVGKIRYGHVEGGTWCTEITLKVTSWVN